MGRILDYGDVIVSTGEDKDVFKYVRSPMWFSTRINEQIDKISTTMTEGAKSVNLPDGKLTI